MAQTKEKEEGASRKNAGKEEFVAYVGGATIREITARQWEQAGIMDQDGANWTVQNRHLVPKDHFSDAALEVLERDGQFKIVTADEVS